MSDVQVEVISQQNYDFPIHLLVNWQDGGTPDNLQEEDESTTDPAGWLAIQLRDLVDNKVLDVVDVQRIVNFGFESEKYSPDISQAIIEAIFAGVLDPNINQTQIEFLANNIFISNANLINIRNGYKNNLDIGYLYTTEEQTRLENDEIVREINYIMVGFGPLVNSSDTEAVDLKTEGVSPILWRVLIDSRNSGMVPIRYPNGDETGKSFSNRFFPTEEAVLYAIISNQATDLLTGIVMDDLLGPQIISPRIPQILLGDVEYKNIFMGGTETFEGVEVVGGYIEVSLRLSGLPENWQGNFLFGHGVPEGLRAMVDQVYGDKQILEAIGGPILNELSGTFSQDYKYRIPVVYINQILQNVVKDNPELLNQALGIDVNNGFEINLGLLLLLSTAGGLAAVGISELKQYLKKITDKMDNELPQVCEDAIEYLNRVVGITHKQPTKKGKETGVDAISRLTKYQEAHNKVSLDEARSLIQLAIALEENPELISAVNSKRKKVNIDHVIRKHAKNQQVLQGDIRGHFELSNLQSEQVIELLSFIGDRIDSKYSRELNTFLTYTRNVINKIELDQSEVREKLNTLVISIEQTIEQLNTGSQNQPRPPHQEKPVETITINGQTRSYEEMFTSEGSRRNRTYYISPNNEQRIQTSENASKELQRIFKYIVDNYSGSPSTIENDLKSTTGKRFQLLEDSDSDACFFRYQNGSEVFIVLYDQTFGSFELEKLEEVEVDTQVENIKRERIISLSRNVIIEDGETAELEQAQIEFLAGRIIQKISSPQTEIDDLAISQYMKNSRYKKNIVNNLATEVINEHFPNLMFEGFANDHTTNSIRKNFARTIAEKTASVILGITTMTEETVEASAFTALKNIRNPGNIKKILAYRDDIGGTRIARIHVFRIEYQDGSFAFQAIVTPSNHNKAL